MIALVVADTSHTRVRRLPAVVGCGTRVHTIPDALATSIAATRSTICSCSSTSTCLPSPTTTAPRPEGWDGAARGARLGTETLIGVLEATVRHPPDRAPAPNCLTASTTKQASGVGGQPRPHFHACTASPQGYKNCLGRPRPVSALGPPAGPAQVR